MSEKNKAKDNTIHHVIVSWLKQPGNAKQRAILIKTIKSFSEIPGVLSVTVGPPLPSERKVVDDSFDVAANISLENAAALQVYQNHPIHVQARENDLSAIIEKYIVYDFID